MKKAVNVPVNAISPLDDIHLEDKLYKLSRLLQGQAVPLGTEMFLASGHQLGVPFCTNLAAKEFVVSLNYDRQDNTFINELALVHITHQHNK